MKSIEILSSNFSEINLFSDSVGIITLSQKKTAIMSQKLLLPNIVGQFKQYNLEMCC